MIEVDIEVEDETWRSPGVSLETSVRAAVELALEDETSGAVTVLLTSNDVVQELNRQFRGKDSPTNVLSFPATPTAKPHLGDIALAYGVCANEARDQGKSFERHVQHLAAHGALHLIGYDHLSEDEAVVMEDKERAIMARLGGGDPYEVVSAAAPPIVEDQHGDV